MKKLATRLGGAAGALSLMLASASGVLAQYDYDYTYDAADSAAATGIVGASWIMVCCFWVLGLAMFAFNVWMLIHAIKNAPEDQKILWILLIFFVPFGSVIYFFTKKKEWDPK